MEAFCHLRSEPKFLGQGADGWLRSKVRVPPTWWFWIEKPPRRLSRETVDCVRVGVSLDIHQQDIEHAKWRVLVSRDVELQILCLVNPAMTLSRGRVNRGASSENKNWRSVDARGSVQIDL
jgi:hypothetical protein